MGIGHSCTVGRVARLCLLFAACSVATAARAEDAGLDSFGYRAVRTAGGFEDIQSTGQLVRGTGSQWGVNVPIGFSFSFYGTPKTTVGVVSAGFLTFGGPTTRVNLAIPDPTAPNAVIAPFWANLDPGLNPRAHVRYQTLGSAPPRRFVVEWVDFPLASDPGSRCTFEAILFEGTNAIELRCGTTSRCARAT